MEANRGRELRVAEQLKDQLMQAQANIDEILTQIHGARKGHDLRKAARGIVRMSRSLSKACRSAHSESVAIHLSLIEDPPVCPTVRIPEYKPTRPIGYRDRDEQITPDLLFNRRANGSGDSEEAESVQTEMDDAIEHFEEVGGDTDEEPEQIDEYDAELVDMIGATPPYIPPSPSQYSLYNVICRVLTERDFEEAEVEVIDSDSDEERASTPPTRNGGGNHEEDDEIQFLDDAIRSASPPCTRRSRRRYTFM